MCMCWLQLNEEEQVIIQSVKEKIALLQKVMNELQSDEECIEKFVIMINVYIYMCVCVCVYVRTVLHSTVFTSKQSTIYQ